MGVTSVIFLSFFTILIAMILKRYEYVRRFGKKHKIPHGPTFYPLIGTLPELYKLKAMTSAQVCKWFKNRYGNFAAYFTGEHFTFFMNDYSLIKELLNSEEFETRVPQHAITFYNYYHKTIGILFSPDEISSKMRSFTVKHLRKLKFGQKTDMTVLYQREIIEFTRIIDEERERNSNTVCLFDFINRSVFTVFWTYLAGDSFPVSNKDLHEVTDALMKVDELTCFGKSMEWYVPFLRHIPGLSEFKTLVKSHEIIKDFFQRVIKQKRESGVFREDPKDYIDYFIKELEEKPSQYMHAEQLQMMCTDLLMGGVLTTSNSIMWGVYHIMKTPRVYKKLMEEIDTVIGTGVPDIEKDQAKMPYMEAVINEIFRLENAVPVTCRSNSRPTTVGGYYIPKGTMLILDLDGPNKCPKLWGDDAHLFCPDRFLDENMKIKKFEHFIPFGSGRRNCIGEKSVRVSIFYHIINFFQNYDFLAPGDIKRIDGISNNCAPFNITLFERKCNPRVKNLTAKNKISNNEILPPSAAADPADKDLENSNKPRFTSQMGTLEIHRAKFNSTGQLTI